MSVAAAVPCSPFTVTCSRFPLLRYDQSMQLSIDELISSGRTVIIAISGSTMHGVIKSNIDGFLMVEVDNQGPRLVNLAMVVQIIPRK